LNSSGLFQEVEIGMGKIFALLLGALFALSMTVSLGSEAEAAKKRPAASKSCKATSLEGKKVSFKCKTSESCCYDGLMAKGNCVPAGQICF
jgi:hypothetical protein